MTLTVVVGSSGSGKTTFLNDVHKINKCTFIRQYHNLRPYIPVNKIPNFNPDALPFWDLYANELTSAGVQNPSFNPAIKIGGTMAGDFTPGLSGGQRKMLLFEIVKQRTASRYDLLIALDEPFAGVTDDFLPFITEQLTGMRKKHNILIVTNDHVAALTAMADNTLTVSALDRTKVSVNGKDYDRELSLYALASGKDFYASNSTDMCDLWFFFDAEVLYNGTLGGVAVFTIFAMSLFVLSNWNSQPGSEALVLVALQIISYFSINPYLISLCDWRNFMTEEAEALMHSSVEMNKALKSFLVLALLLMISLVAFGALQLCIDTLSAYELWISLLFDSASLTLPLICLGLYSSIPLQMVQTLGSMPFLFMVFFSTTFSPGAGVKGLKNMRYLFARFYLWCRVPGYENLMEGCPPSNELTPLSIFTGCLGAIIFLCALIVLYFKRKQKLGTKITTRNHMESLPEFKKLRADITRNQLSIGVPKKAARKHVDIIPDSLPNSKEVGNTPSKDLNSVPNPLPGSEDVKKAPRKGPTARSGAGSAEIELPGSVEIKISS